MACRSRPCPTWRPSATGTASICCERHARHFDADDWWFLTYRSWAVDVLKKRDVPFVFATGYSAVTVPDLALHVSRWEKPHRLEEIARALPTLIHRS